ncbi:hypothetical protein BT69DRAFT_1284175, partial [Atractiella rhizophila]
MRLKGAAATVLNGANGRLQQHIVRASQDLETRAEKSRIRTEVKTKKGMRISNFLPKYGSR